MLVAMHQLHCRGCRRWLLAPSEAQLTAALVHDLTGCRHMFLVPGEAQAPCALLLHCWCCLPLSLVVPMAMGTAVLASAGLQRCFWSLNLKIGLPGPAHVHVCASLPCFLGKVAEPEGAVRVQGRTSSSVRIVHLATTHRFCCNCLQ